MTVQPFQKFNSFVNATAGLGVHKLATDSLKVMLTNTAPVAANTKKSDLTDITAGNGYTAGGTVATVASSAQTSGTYKLVLNDVTFTATGAVGPFRYAVLYNDTDAVTPKALIGFWDNTTAVTLANTESFTVDFDPTNGVLTLA